MKLVPTVVTGLLAWAPALAQQVELQVLPAPPPPNGSPDYNFDVGGRVAISGEWLAVADFAANSGAGEVYMFRRSASGWQFRQRLGEDLSGFGGSVAIERDTLVVGGWLWNNLLGKVYVYRLTDTGWVKTQEILPDGVPADGPKFGRAVALSGDVLVVGAPDVNVPLPNGGEVRVYERRAGLFEPVARFRLPLNSDVMNNEYRALGDAVAVSGDTIVAGAHTYFGAVFVYERGPSGWTRTAIIENPAPLIGDEFGLSVSIEDDTLVVGRPHLSSIVSIVGKAYVYQRAADRGWVLVDELRASDGYTDAYAGDWFGQSVTIEGDRIVVGASRGRFNGPSTGTVYLFQRRPDGWPDTEDMRLVASDSSGDSDRLGRWVAMHRGFIAAGAIGAWHGGIREGKAYAFTVELGDAYCTPAESDARLGITGSPVALDQRLTLTVRGAPPNARALLLLSPNAGSYPFGNDTLCLGAPVTRVAYVTTGDDGVVLHDLNFGAPWLATKLVAGSTWHFQAAHARHSGARRLDTITNAVSLTLE